MKTLPGLGIRCAGILMLLLSCCSDGERETGLESAVSLEVAASLAFSEGPAYHPDGRLFFTDIATNKIVVLDASTPQGTVGRIPEVFREPSGLANGLAIDREGRLLACEGADRGGNRRVTRTEEDGTITVLASNYMGSRLNSPNDLALDRKGRIYFTDPRYGDRSDMEMEVEGVYRIDPDGALTRIIEHLQRPNGIGVSPDQQTLYVVDNNSTEGGSRKVWSYPLASDGSVGTARLLRDFGTGRGGDGICQDKKGRVYVTAGLSVPAPGNDSSVAAGVYVLSAEGAFLEFLRVPEDAVTNCTFGGSDGRTLFVTSGKTLFTTRRDTPGFSVANDWE